MTLDEMFYQINRMTEITQHWHDAYIVQLEVKYLYDEKPEVITTILWHEIGAESCFTEFMPKGFSWYDDWYHCCRKEDVKVLNYKDIDHIFPPILLCRDCKYASLHCTQYDEDVAATDGCSNGERDVL